MTKHFPRTSPPPAGGPVRSRQRVAGRIRVRRSPIRADYVLRGLECLTRPEYPSPPVLRAVAEQILTRVATIDPLPRR